MGITFSQLFDTFVIRKLGLARSLRAEEHSEPDLGSMLRLLLLQRDAGDRGISSHMVPRPETVIGGPKQTKKPQKPNFKHFPPPPEPYGSFSFVGLYQTMQEGVVELLTKTRIFLNK